MKKKIMMASIAFASIASAVQADREFPIGAYEFVFSHIEEATGVGGFYEGRIPYGEKGVQAVFKHCPKKEYAFTHHNVSNVEPISTILSNPVQKIIPLKEIQKAIDAHERADFSRPLIPMSVCDGPQFLS